VHQQAQSPDPVTFRPLHETRQHFLTRHIEPPRRLPRPTSIDIAMPAQGDTSCLHVLQGFMRACSRRRHSCRPERRCPGQDMLALRHSHCDRRHRHQEGHSQEVCPHQLAGQSARDRYPGKLLHELGSRREPRLQLPEETRHLALQRGGNTLPALRLRSVGSPERKTAGPLPRPGDLNASRFTRAPLIVFAARNAGHGAGLGTILLFLGAG
jgi:hypothetical protein